MKVTSFGSRVALRASAIALALAMFQSSALAATVLKVDVAAATRLSEWVVRAKVLAVESVDLRAQGDSIYTDVTLSIEAVYAGHDVPKISVMRLQGGLGRDGLALTVPGMPVFKVGDEAVLFLEKTGLGHVPCGLEQGVWRISPGPFNYPVVSQSLAGLSRMTRTGDGRLAPSTEPLPTGVKLLSQLVREIVAAR